MHVDSINDVIGKGIEQFLDPEQLRKFNEIRDDVMRTRDYQHADLRLKIGDKFQANKLTISPWFNDEANVIGVILSFEGEMAGFVMDEEGYVTDCTAPAARYLGYNKEDIAGLPLVTFLDEDSLLSAGDRIMDIFDEDMEPEDNEECTRVIMKRETGRMLQVTWDLQQFRTPNNELRAMVIMHKEKWLGVRGRKNMKKVQDKEAQEKEDPKLRHVVMPTQRDLPDGPQKEEPELTAAERAEKEREPVRFHFCVMQREQDMSGTCNFDDFKTYLRNVNPPELRPWGLHRTNCFLKKAMQTKYMEIVGGNKFNNVAFDFDTWQQWWNGDQRRTGWDGGPMMEFAGGHTLATAM